jgi:hypothetical protein
MEQQTLRTGTTYKESKDITCFDPNGMIGSLMYYT